MYTLDSALGIPLYEQLAQKIREDIDSGVLKQGAQIPTEHELETQYSISRSTVRKAVAMLVEEQRLVKMHGKGTFVAPPILQTNKQTFVSTTHWILDSGESLKSKVLDALVMKPTAKECEFFGITDKNEKVVAVRRLRSIGERPICIETIILPTKYFHLLNEDFSGSFYDILKNKYRIIPSGGYSTFEICNATDDEAELMEVDLNSPMMLIRDYVYDQSGSPLHISKRVHMGDTIKYGCR